MKKTILSLLLAISLLFVFPVASVNAESELPDCVKHADGSFVYSFDDGSLLEISAPRTVDELQSNGAKGTLATTTAEIDATYKNASGTLEWKYTLHATFSYTYGVSATCTSASYTQKIYGGNWEFSNGATSRSGNKANGTGVYQQKLLFIVIRTVNVNLVLTCDKYGVVS